MMVRCSNCSARVPGGGCTPPGGGPALCLSCFRESHGHHPLPPASPRPHQTLLGGFAPMDLSSVRVHTDASAHDAARAVSAHAFTHGGRVTAGPNHPPPGGLLAHELAHTVQQRQGR